MMGTLKKNVARIVAIHVWIALWPGAVSAATLNIYTWDGSAGDGDWFNAANWSGPSGNGIPGQTHNVATPALDQAYMAAASNVAGTITYAPGTPTTFDYLNIAKNDATLLTINVNGAMTVEHNNVADPDWWFASTLIGNSGGNLTFNVNAATCMVKQANIGIYAKEFNVAAGATFIGFAGSPNANRAVTFGGGTMTLRGWFGTWGKSQEYSAYNNRLIVGAGEVVVAEGGTLYPDGVFFSGRYGTLTITNGTFLTRYGGSGITHEGNYGTGGYHHDIRMYGGTATNVSTLRLAGRNPAGSQYLGFARMNMRGGRWFQGGATHIGDGREGTLTVKGGVFTTPNDVYVGGGRKSGDAAPTGAAYALGILTVTGGTVIVSNPEAGTIHTASGAGRQNPGMATHYFSTGTAWDRTYLHQRVVIDTLAGAGNGLASAVPYYAADVNPVGLNTKTTFGFSMSPGGLGLTGTVAYAAGSTYHTLPARLLIGNMMTFNDGTRMVTGVLNLVSGSLTADEWVATNGVASIVNFSGGALNVKQSRIATGSALTVGNGTSAAVLNLLTTNLHAFADGLAIGANATLAPGGTGVVQAVKISGNVTLSEGARLGWDYNAATQDWAAVTGTVVLPSSATVLLNGMDASLPKTIPLLSATGGFAGSPANWPQVFVGARFYRATVAGSVLRLDLAPLASVIAVR